MAKRKLRDPVPVGSLSAGREFLTPAGKKGTVVRVGPGMAIVSVEARPKTFRTKGGKVVEIPQWEEGPWSLNAMVIPLGKGG